MSSAPERPLDHRPHSPANFKTTAESCASSTSSNFTIIATPTGTPSSPSKDSDNTTTPAMADSAETATSKENVSTPKPDSSKSKEVELPNPEQASPNSQTKATNRQHTAVKGKKASHKSHRKESKKKSKKRSKVVDSSSSEDSSSSDSSSSSSSEDGDDSSDDDDEGAKKKRKAKSKKAKKLKEKRKAKEKKAKAEESGTESDSEEASSSSEDEKERSKKKKRLKAKKRAKKSKKVKDEDKDEGEEIEEDTVSQLRAQMNALAMTKRPDLGGETLGAARKTGTKGKKKVGKKGSKVDFVRVDRVWDTNRHNYVLKATAEDPDVGEYDQYVFQVRRKFDWENKYQSTVLDIKSKALKEALKDVMQDVKGVSFAEETPVVDPNMIFLYLEEMRAHMKKLKKLGKIEKKSKLKKKGKIPAATKAKHTKVLIKYLDKDYADIKKTLYPLLESNKITFDLLWALYKSNEVAYCPTYSNLDEPRAFKIEYANLHSSFVKGKYYTIEGRYLEYDGKTFGMGSMEVEVPEFTGPRNISTLGCYPLRYHKEAEKLKEQLVERGKKFASLKGMQYKFHKGMAFYKKKRQIIRVNINGRVMVDPAIHRRINPNYPVSTVKAADPDIIDDSDEDQDKSSCCESSSDEEGTGQKAGDQFGETDKPITKWKFVKDDKGRYQCVEIEIDGDGNAIQKEDINKLPGQDEAEERGFTEEEFLIASPVVLGFAFSEKLWLELTVSGISHIDWNDGAYESLVLPDNQKSIVKALVKSHTFEGSRNIDDVIQGKGRGLVAVLHGPPGTGKTLTAEGIAELLKRPLYMVSVGELGTNAQQLEHELNKILDVAHSWGAVLLLDEADVFLEARQPQDVSRNALVSIFLRLLEYFQGILFLTTNRVQTFDPAFQSRIHVALRYGELTNKAKKSVWKTFVEKMIAIEGVDVEELSEEDYERLARRNLNGRQIKNAVRTAQALAIDEKKPLSIKHIVTVLDVAETFEQDLKGGTGYSDAMRSYH